MIVGHGRPSQASGTGSGPLSGGAPIQSQTRAPQIGVCWAAALRAFERSQGAPAGDQRGVRTCPRAAAQERRSATWRRSSCRGAPARVTRAGEGRTTTRIGRATMRFRHLNDHFLRSAKSARADKCADRHPTLPSVANTQTHSSAQTHSPPQAALRCLARGERGCCAAALFNTTYINININIILCFVLCAHTCMRLTTGHRLS